MKNLFKKIMPVLLGLVISVSTANAKQFSDMTEEHWAYPQINQLAKEGIVVGYPDGTYKPDAEITRAEFASMVVKALKQQDADITDVINFSDVPKDNWAWPSIQRAVRFDLIHETDDNNFRPNDSVTRAECLEIVVNSLTTDELSLDEAKKLLAERYVDHNSIPQWFIIKAGKAEVLGIVVKVPGEEAKMYATKAATRAEVAAFLFNMIEQVKLAPNKKLAEVMKPITADGVVLEDAIVKGNVGIIPAGTVLPLVIMDDMNSQSSVVSDIFEAKVPKNFITPQKYLLIPENSTVKGQLIDKQKAYLLFKNGKMVLNTKLIVTPADQTAALIGVTETDPKLSIWRKIFKGNKVKYTQGEVIPVKLLKTVKVDLTNSWILE